MFLPPNMIYRPTRCTFARVLLEQNSQRPSVVIAEIGSQEGVIKGRNLRNSLKYVWRFMCHVFSAMHRGAQLPARYQRDSDTFGLHRSTQPPLVLTVMLLLSPRCSRSSAANLGGSYTPGAEHVWQQPQSRTPYQPSSERNHQDGRRDGDTLDCCWP